jgi:hypothetical protein
VRTVVANAVSHAMGASRTCSCNYAVRIVTQLCLRCGCVLVVSAFWVSLIICALFSLESVGRLRATLRIIHASGRSLCPLLHLPNKCLPSLKPFQLCCFSHYMITTVDRLLLLCVCSVAYGISETVPTAIMTKRFLVSVLLWFYAGVSLSVRAFDLPQIHRATINGRRHSQCSLPVLFCLQ